MANDFAVPLSSPLSNDNYYTKQIHKIFTEHWNTLEDRRKKDIEEIDQWQQRMQEDIQTRADKQKKRINKHYNRLRPTLDENYRVHLESAGKHHDEQQDNLSKELLEKCQSLKFQVTTLEWAVHNIEVMEVVVREELLTANSFMKRQARLQRRMNKNGETKILTMTTTDGSPPDSPMADQNRTEYV